MSLTPGVSLRLSVRHGVQTAGMFTLMCVLWTFWASPTIDGFTSMVGGARPRAIDAVWLLSGLTVVAVKTGPPIAGEYPGRAILTSRGIVN